MRIDLRSVNADEGDDDTKSTPRGWLSRKFLTPRGSQKKDTYDCTQITVEISCGNERLGLELNAYNQILSFVPNSPCDRHPELQLHDRILEVSAMIAKPPQLTLDFQ